MPVLELIFEGLELMAIGMTVVFIFLGMLVILVTGMSRLALKLRPVPTPLAVESQSDAKADELVAVIGSAIYQYKNRTK